MAGRLIERYLRPETLPHMWCPGCGNGILLQDILRAIDHLGLKKDRVCIVSGIGCSSRASFYMDFNTIHTMHGRAIPVATGIKMADPSLEVLVITGDGDAAAIGGNHLIHGARRNIDLTVVVFNNNIYGMTGGQYSPTTPQGALAATAPYGVLERPLDIVALAQAAGATYTAQGDCYHTLVTTALIEAGIRHKGFSLINCWTVCPTYYGRKNGCGDAAEMLRWQRARAVPVGAPGGEGKVRAGEGYWLGQLSQEEYPEYTQRWQALVQRVQEGGK